MISFTGSTATGRKVGETAGRSLKRMVLEMGGNSPLVVLEDADVEAASSAGAWGSFLHQGQICLAVSRHLVHESIADAYIEALAARASHLPVGNPATEQVALGPIINAKQVERVVRIVDDSVSQGARRGHRRHARRARSSSPPCSPTSRRSMPAFTDEIFGPVAPVTTFRDDAEAVELANATAYGLVAAVQSGSPQRARGGRRPAARRHGPRERLDDQRGAAGAVRRLRVLEQRRPLRRRREPRAVDRVAVDDVARQGRAVPVLDFAP